jgi:signal transduction histidine kinase
MFLDQTLSDRDIYTFITVGIFFTIAFAILIWLTLSPGISVVRRLLGIILDNGASTAAIYFNGILGAPLFIVYLWVSFGNGFRYGQKYLIFSAILGFCGFSSVVFFSDNFQMDRSVALGLFAGLIVLPLYVASLLNQVKRSLKIAETANRAKSNFLATMSHEIRTPLNGMVGITEILSRTSLSSQQRHYVNLISRSSEWLMRVITDGLDFSKIEAGEFLISNETFDLSVSLSQFCILYEDLQKHKEVKFTSTIDPHLPQLVVGDQLRLNQVLSNLVSNSLKFTHEGEVHFAAKVLFKKSDGVGVLFTVTDTGPGIAPEKQDVVFEPFRQAESGIAKKYGGTGLGLAIAARIVALLGGKLKLTSTLGQGSVFSFVVFFKNPSEQEIKTIEKDKKNRKLSLGWTRPPQLLVVEDHEINREVIVNQLNNMDCLVALAGNGYEALEYLENNVVDLVLMDCQMPEMDGYTATRHIREKEAADGHVTRLPIVALTAHVTVDDKNKCLEAGMDDYLGKPFTFELLQKKLNKWLQPLVSEHSEQMPTVVLKDYEPDEEEKKEKRVRSESEKLLHDLKNMLLAIYGSAELSKLTPANSEGQQKHMDRIYKAAAEANRIVESLAADFTEKRH